MPRRAPISPEWARARILLNLLDIPAATEAAVAAWGARRLPKGTRFGLAEVIGCRDVPPGWCFFHPHYSVAVFNFEVWDEHASYRVIYDFAERIVDLRVPTWMHYDQESWRMLDELDRANHAGAPIPDATIADRRSSRRPAS